MSDLADFLLARFAEDEAAARKGTHRPGGAGAIACLPDGTREHVLNWGPFRVLAECEAKRRILEWHHKIPLPYERRWLLRLLALPYADHPDWREEWRP